MSHLHQRQKRHHRTYGLAIGTILPSFGHSHPFEVKIPNIFSNRDDLYFHLSRLEVFRKFSGNTPTRVDHGRGWKHPWKCNLVDIDNKTSTTIYYIHKRLTSGNRIINPLCQQWRFDLSRKMPFRLAHGPVFIIRIEGNEYPKLKMKDYSVSDYIEQVEDNSRLGYNFLSNRPSDRVRRSLNHQLPPPPPPQQHHQLQPFLEKHQHQRYQLVGDRRIQLYQQVQRDENQVERSFYDQQHSQQQHYHYPCYQQQQQQQQHYHNHHYHYQQQQQQEEEEEEEEYVNHQPTTYFTYSFKSPFFSHRINDVLDKHSFEEGIQILSEKCEQENWNFIHEKSSYKNPILFHFIYFTLVKINNSEDDDVHTCVVNNNNYNYNQQQQQMIINTGLRERDGNHEELFMIFIKYETTTTKPKMIFKRVLTWFEATRRSGGFQGFRKPQRVVFSSQKIGEKPKFEKDYFIDFRVKELYYENRSTTQNIFPAYWSELSDSDLDLTIKILSKNIRRRIYKDPRSFVVLSIKFIDDNEQQQQQKIGVQFFVRFLENFVICLKEVVPGVTSSFYQGCDVSTLDWGYCYARVIGIPTQDWLLDYSKEKVVENLKISDDDVVDVVIKEEVEEEGEEEENNVEGLE